MQSCYNSCFSQLTGSYLGGCVIAPPTVSDGLWREMLCNIAEANGISAIIIDGEIDRDKRLFSPSGFKEWKQRKESIHFSVRSWPIGERGKCLVSARNRFYFICYFFYVLYRFYVVVVFVWLWTHKKGEWELWFIICNRSGRQYKDF